MNNRDKNIIAVEHAIGVWVWVKEADVRGRVKRIAVFESSVDYLVAYFDADKVRREEWLEAQELSGIKA
jgi:hypothetical protein